MHVLSRVCELYLSCPDWTIGHWDTCFMILGLKVWEFLLVVCGWIARDEQCLGVGVFDNSNLRFIFYAIFEGFVRISG